MEKTGKLKRNDITELVFILDRSGSMGGFEDDTIGGFNSLIEKQKKVDGKALVTTVAGLAVSMPCLFVFGIIKNRLNLYAVLLEEEVADLVNQIFVKK